MWALAADRCRSSLEPELRLRDAASALLRAEALLGGGTRFAEALGLIQEAVNVRHGQYFSALPGHFPAVASESVSIV